MADLTGIYFDSALIAKFYLNEPGNQAVHELARASGPVISSGLAVAEVSAAFHRNLREGAISQKVFASLHGQFALDVERKLWRFVPVSEGLLDEVRALFAKLSGEIYLRAADAIHLATAKAENFEQVYSNDRHLLAACSVLGLCGVNPL